MRTAVSLPAFSERKATASEEPKLLEAAKDWKGGGLLALLTDENTLSDRVLKGGPYPSELSEPAAEGLASKAAAAGYMTEHFGRYGSEGESELLVYEAEYILGGKASDRENLEYVAGRLTAVRTGLNFLYLMGDQAKRAEAEALAAGLVGFTGIAPLLITRQHAAPPMPAVQIVLYPPLKAAFVLVLVIASPFLFIPCPALFCLSNKHKLP